MGDILKFHERSIHSSRVVFTNTIRAGRSYIPSVTLFKNEKRMITILSRQLHDNGPDRNMAFIEMFSTVACLDPDAVLFSADTFFDIDKLVNGIGEDNEFAETSVEERGLPAFYTVFMTRQSLAISQLEPFTLDNDHKVWWVHIPDLKIIERGPHSRVHNDKRSDRITEIVEKMYHAKNSFPMKPTELFELLREMGYRIYQTEGVSLT